MRHKKTAIFLFVFSVVLSGYAQNSVTFDVNGATAVVQHEVFGLLMERLGRQWSAIYDPSKPNTNGMRNDVIEGFKECGVGCAQWPGGCAANGYNWSSAKNPSNDVGVDRFIEFCKLTGAEACIVGKPNANDAASNEAFAKYVIEDLDYPLKWFKVGNEIWGGCGTNYTGGYSSAFSANYDRLKNLRETENGKNLKIIAAANSSEGNYSWISGYYDNLGEKMDGIEYHDYIYHPDNISSSNPSESNYWQIMREILSSDFAAHFKTIVSEMDKKDPQKRVKMVMDEWGNWLQDLGDGWMQHNSVMDAVGAGAHLNMFISNADRVGIAALAQGVNVIQSIININQSGVMVKTTSFYVFKMYKPHHTDNAKFAPITASNFNNVNGNVPSGNAAATVDDNGIVNISITNVDLASTHDVTVTLTSDAEKYTVKSAEVVTGPALNSGNDFGKDEVVNIKTLDESNYSLEDEGKTLKVTMPTKSVVMVRLQPPTSTYRQHGNMLNNSVDAFSIKAGPQGTIITSSASRKTPVTISLYSVDGRVLLDKVSKTFDAGSNSFVLKNNTTGAGVYLVKINGTGINLTKQVIVSR